MGNVEIKGNLVDVINEDIYKAVITLSDGVIVSIERDYSLPDGMDYIMQGLIDAHVHIESSMLTPAEFARIAVRHGVVGVVTDPHEIANVLGEPGVDFMIEDSKRVRFNFLFGAPSCVPATSFETSGAVLGPDAIERLMRRKEVGLLSEMMNYVGVLNDDADVMAKIEIAKKYGKPIDGHAPALSGDGLAKYASAGISTDHECSTLQEAEEKIKKGMKILIREGSAARNFDALCPLIDMYPDNVMMCADDKHPDDLLDGYIDKMCAEAIRRGCGLLNVIKAGFLNAVKHYGIKHGKIKVGERAEFIILDENWKVKKTYIDGEEVYGEDGVNPVFWREKKKYGEEDVPNIMNHAAITKEDIVVKADGDEALVNVIVAEDGNICTRKEQVALAVENGAIKASADKDVLKMVVVNRYEKDAKPSVAYIKGFGLKCGALGSTISHDCHNILCVGVDDESIVKAVNRLVEIKGGLVVVDDEGVEELKLPFAGLMSNMYGRDVANAYKRLNAKVIGMGSGFHAPFMTLSFMALLVIPELKLSDKGLFDGSNFRFIDLKAE